MGGLSDGEIASNTVLRAFLDWFSETLPAILEEGQLTNERISRDWSQIAQAQNQQIGRYAAKRGIHMGTTATALLLAFGQYYVMNVGDTRLYLLRDGVEQLTEDQTFVARELAQGRMTKEQAAADPRRNVLLQCIGASNEVTPDFFFGDYREGDAFLLCTDGFRHLLRKEELQQAFMGEDSSSEQSLKQQCVRLTELNKQRGETDNITAAIIKAVRG